MPQIRWPLLSDVLADPSAPGFPVSEYLTDPKAKYARSTDYRFHRSSVVDFRERERERERWVFSSTAPDFPQAR